MKITTDKFLDGKIIVKQPENGYRAGIDAVLLASSINLKSNNHILEIGSGVGTVMLCILSRCPSVYIKGLELQSNLVDLCQQNIIDNHFENKAEIFQGNIANPPSILQPNSYDHVISNPPFYNYGNQASNDFESKSLSKHVSDVGLNEWVTGCLRFVKPLGYLTIIHKADQLDDIISAIKPKTGEIKIFPLWPSQGKSAKLVIIQARKSSKTGCCILPGLVLHQQNGEYTSEAGDIFRGNAVIDL